MNVLWTPANLLIRTASIERSQKHKQKCKILCLKNAKTQHIDTYGPLVHLERLHIRCMKKAPKTALCANWIKKEPESFRIPAFSGRGDRIWTCDLLVPNQTRYQTALHLDNMEPMRGLEPLACWLRISCSTNWATLAHRTTTVLNYTTVKGRLSSKWFSGFNI